MAGDPSEGRPYSVAEVDALTEQAGTLLTELRAVLAEIGQRMTSLTDPPGKDQ